VVGGGFRRIFVTCRVEWVEDGPTVRVAVSGTVDSASARRMSAEIASHVGIDGVEVVEVDASSATLEPAGAQVLEELARRFSGAGQRLVVTAGVHEGDRATALR
jgi:hypothetical protein